MNKIAKFIIQKSNKNIIVATSFVDLKGSEKQITWAEKLRKEFFPIFEEKINEFKAKLQAEKFTNDELEDKVAFLMDYFFPRTSYYSYYSKRIKTESNYEQFEKWVTDNYSEMLDALKKINDSGWWIDHRAVDHQLLTQNIFTLFLDSKREGRKFGY